MYLSKVLRVALLCSIIGFANSLKAQPGLPRIINFSRSAMSGGTQNWQIRQDSDRIIYLANNEGLISYNGVTFRKYPLPNKSIIRSIYTDSLSDRIYVGGQQEIGFFSKNEKNIPEYTDITNLIPAQSRAFDDVWSILQGEGHIYFITGLGILDYSENKIKVILSPGDKFSKGYHVDKENLIVTSNGTIYSINQGLLTNYNIANLDPEIEIVSILKFNNKKLIITRFNGVFIINNGIASAWENFPKEIRDALIYTSCNVNDSTIAIATTLNGVYLIDRDSKIKMHAEVNSGLQNNHVLSLYLDYDRNLWVGHDNGLDMIRVSSPIKYITPDAQRKGTGYAVEEWNGKIWFGTNNGVFYKNLEESSEAYSILPGTEGQVWNLQKIGQKLFIHHHEGLFVYDGQKLEKIGKEKGSWDLIALKSHPGYYIEGSYLGLSLYSIKDKELKFIKKLDGFNESSRFIAQDQNANIWVSHPYKGIFRITIGDNPEVITSMSRISDKEGLNGKLNFYVFDLGNEILFTGSEGVFSFNNSKDQFIHNEKFEEFFSADETILKLYSLSQKRIWFITDKRAGLISIEEKSLQKNVRLVQLPVFDRPITGGFPRIKEINQRVYFNLEPGFLSMPVKTSAENLPVPKPIISSVDIVDGQLFPKYMNYINQEQGELYFTSNQRNLEFRYGSVNAFFGDSLKFSSRIKGLESSWQPWSFDQKRNLSMIPFGSYTFELKCRYGQIEGQLLSLPFSIKAPWYWNFWSKLIYSLIICLLLSIAIFLPQRRIWAKSKIIIAEKNRRIIEKEEEMKVETQKNEDKIMQLQNESMKAKIDYQNKQLASTTMHILQKNKTLIYIKDKLEKIGKATNDESIIGNIKDVNRLIEQDARTEKNWEDFEVYFDEVYAYFIQTLRQRYPKLSQNDIRICAYLRMNLSTKEIATLMNISVRGVEITRYRLRKKLELETETNLSEFIQSI